MVLPIFLQKFLSNNSMMWDIKYQYSVEFAPIIIFGVIALTELRSLKRYRLIIVSMVMLSSIYWTIREVVLRDVRSNIFAAEHYQPSINQEAFREIEASIDDKAILSVSSHLSPHVSDRSVVYVWPVLNDARYVLIDRNRLEPNEHSVVQDILQNSEWKVLKERGSLLLVERAY
jgi:uncharacterized membrane protein